MSRPRSREAAKDFDENLVASEVVDAALEIHRDLGPGLLESVYEIVLADELSRRGIPTERQVPVPISYKGRKFLEAFRADLIAAGKVCVEIKSVEAFSKSDPKQLRTYLRLLNLRIGWRDWFGRLFLFGAAAQSQCSPAQQCRCNASV